MFAAFPSSKADATNMRAYAEQFIPLHHPEALNDAVNSLIRSERWLPPVADVLDEYSRHRSKYAPREIEQHASISEEERTENLKRLQAMRDHLEGHSGPLDECAQPACVWLRGDE